VAHHIRNPLSVISANIQMMLMKDRPNEPHAQILNLLLKKVEETDATVRELMEVAKPLALNMKKASLVKSLKNLEQFILARCQAQKVDLEVKLGENLPEVWLDETQFQRCLLDICLNALQEMPQG
jgi:signal transduction histidine kinase